MQLSPTYRAVLAAIPDLSWIYNFKEALGRGRCPWVYGMTKAGHRVARFIKKGLIKFNTWLTDSEVVSLNRERIYKVSQSECNCPEWRHRVSQGKAYRHIPGLFKGHVNMCKHQVAQWLRMHDVSHFSEFIEVIKPEQNNVIRLSETAAPEGIQLIYQEENDPILSFDVYFQDKLIGTITEEQDCFEVRTLRSHPKEFIEQNDGLNWLIKQHELSAARDLLGDDMYPEVEQKPEPQKQEKRWFSLSDMSSQKHQVIDDNSEEVNLLGDYGNWLEPDPAWDEYEEF